MLHMQFVILILLYLHKNKYTGPQELEYSPTAIFVIYKIFKKLKEWVAGNNYSTHKRRQRATIFVSNIKKRCWICAPRISSQKVYQNRSINKLTGSVFYIDNAHSTFKKRNLKSYSLVLYGHESWLHILIVVRR